MKHFITKIIFLVFPLLCLLPYNLFAQLPDCGQGLIYIQDGTSISNFYPTQPVSATNPILNTITLPPGSQGLAVSENLNAATPSPTFYTIVSGTFYYYDGATWVNTGHSTGNPSAVNIGAGGGYIYNLVGGTGQIYRYDGTGNATLLVTLPFNGDGPFDVQGDCAGNFYLIAPGASPQYMEKYDPSGNLLHTWALQNCPVGFSGAGFAIIGNQVYCQQNALLGGPGLFSSGTINATNDTVIFAAPTASFSAGDFASCPLGGGEPNHVNDTFYYCPGGAALPLSSSGPLSVTWTVGNGGNATITGTGQDVTVTATQSSVIYATSFDTTLCEAGTPILDTFTIIAPQVDLSVSPRVDSIMGCGAYIDTLKASMTTDPSWLDYSILWTSSEPITSGEDSLNPVIEPTANADYIITVSTPTAQGGCAWTDTASIILNDLSVFPDFSYTLKYGCREDTIELQNLSTGYQPSSYWDFGDGNTDTVQAPSHIYQQQGTYFVRLYVDNGLCKDSTMKQISTSHPLEASFLTDTSLICEGGTITFTNTSDYTEINGPASFLWNFETGVTDTAFNTTHTFNAPGIYNVSLIATDFVPCSDTAYHTIVVDSMPQLSYTQSDSVICQGDKVIFHANITQDGLNSLAWYFGDVPDSSFNSNPAQHSFDQPGFYTVYLNGQYRVCPGVDGQMQVRVSPLPVINLGPDTSLCLNGVPIVLEDGQNKNNPLASWRWNTGDTTASLVIRHDGRYTNTVTIDHCSATDEVVVKKDCYLDIPNSFTPNNDGENDYFLPRQLLSSGAVAFRMSIYNRWGEIVFRTLNVNGRGWDGTFNGKAQPLGVYIYKIEATFKNGRKENYTGNVTLLR